MGRILAFKTPSDDYVDIEALLRDFYAQEREARECGWLEEAVRKAREISRMGLMSRSLENEAGASRPALVSTTSRFITASHVSTRRN